MSADLTHVHDPVAGALDEMADLAAVWARNRERGRMPNGTRQAMLTVAREALMYEESDRQETQAALPAKAGS